MLRQHESTVSLKAGVLSIAVHAILLLGLLVSFNWKTTHVVSVAEVELWDSIPNSPAPKPLPPPEPVVKEAPKPEPEPVVEEKPKEDVKVDIALEKKQKELAQKALEQKALEAKKLEQKKIEEKLNKEREQKKKLAALQEASREEALQDKNKSLKEKKASSQNGALKKIQQEALAEGKTEGDQQAVAAKAAANAGVVGEFTDKIKAKIRGNVNKTLCGNGNPELKFDISLLPTGELGSSPKLVKSSGNSACDEAVERAIIASEPLPLPKDASLFSQFKSLKLTFRPND